MTIISAFCPKLGHSNARFRSRFSPMHHSFKYFAYICRRRDKCGSWIIHICCNESIISCRTQLLDGPCVVWYVLYLVQQLEFECGSRFSLLIGGKRWYEELHASSTWFQAIYRLNISIIEREYIYLVPKVNLSECVHNRPTCVRDDRLFNYRTLRMVGWNSSLW